MNARALQYVGLSVVATGLCAAYLVGQPGDLPMDDAYIHCQYADNLVHEGRLVFNPGEFTGVGATSILWVLLLAAFKLAGVPSVVAAKALGMASFVVGAWAVFELGRLLFGRLLGERGDFAAFFGACLYLLSGNLIWFSLSGMETMLFLALGLWALVFYESERFVTMCVCLALMTLTRTEGVVLAGLLLALQLLRTLRIGRGRCLRPVRQWLQARYPEHTDAWFGSPAAGTPPSLRRARATAWQSVGRVLGLCLLFAVLVAPWFAFVYRTTGHPLPTSFSGKRLSQMAGLDFFLRSRPYLAPLVHVKPLVFIGLWIGYLLTYVFGGAVIPGPTLPVGRAVGLPDSVQLSVAAVVLVLGAIVPLFVRGLKSAKDWWLSAFRGSNADRALLALFLWVAFHNLAYMLLFPSMGTTTRYQAINHLIVWLLVAVGVFSLRRRRALFAGALVVVTVVACLNADYWRGVYAANMDHMHRVRIASSVFLDRTLPPDAIVAAHDIGAIRYYCNRTLVDLGGLIDARFLDYEKRDAVDDYLLLHGVKYLVIPGKHSSEAKPLYDFVAFLGLWDSDKVQLVKRWSFENDYDVWAEGMKPTGNYQPSVTIYEVVPKSTG